MKNKSFSITKVVSKNFVSDFIAHFQNLIGKNLTGYEKMVSKATEQCWAEVKKRKIKKVAWHRFEITQLTNGAVAIMMYGEAK